MTAPLILVYLGVTIAMWYFFAKRYMGMHQVKVADLKMLRMMDPKPQYLDVRTHGEWDKSHLSMAVHCSLDQIETFSGDQEQTWVTYCISGVRAWKAASLLGKRGYKKVYACSVPVHDLIKELEVKV